VSITLRATVGRHRPTVIIAGLRSQVRDLKADKQQLAANAYRAADEIHTALIRGCQDAMLIARLRAENTAVKKANEEWRRTVIRAKAEQERLGRPSSKPGRSSTRCPPNWPGRSRPSCSGPTYRRCRTSPPPTTRRSNCPSSTGRSTPTDPGRPETASPDRPVNNQKPPSAANTRGSEQPSQENA
jgi:hypothetical protein